MHVLTTGGKTKYYQIDDYVICYHYCSDSVVCKQCHWLKMDLPSDLPDDYIIAKALELISWIS